MKLETRYNRGKFISENDVLTTIITSNKDIKIEFEGESLGFKINSPI